METQKLPDLPPRLKSAVLAAADNITAIAHSEGIALTETNGAAKEPLITILYMLRERIAQVEREVQPYLGDQFITLSDIATVLETITHILISEGIYDFAGHNPSWYSDAANLLEQIAQEHE